MQSIDAYTPRVLSRHIDLSNISQTESHRSRRKKPHTRRITVWKRRIAQAKSWLSAVALRYHVLGTRTIAF
jgi:hypothetical protein